MEPTGPYFPLNHKDTHTPAYPQCFTSRSLSTPCYVPSWQQLATKRQDLPASSSSYHHYHPRRYFTGRHGCNLGRGSSAASWEAKGDFSGVAGYDFTILFFFMLLSVCSLRIFCVLHLVAQLCSIGFSSTSSRALTLGLCSFFLLRLHIFFWLLQRHLFSFEGGDNP